MTLWRSTTHLGRSHFQFKARIALVPPVIFGLWGWRAIVWWSGFWNSDCRLTRSTTMGAIDLLTSATLLSQGKNLGIYG